LKTNSFYSNPYCIKDGIQGRTQDIVSYR